MNLAVQLAGSAAPGHPSLPPSLRVNPRLDRWLRIRPEGWVEVRSGKVEIGQGILTALAQIAADALDVPMSCVRVIAATTGASPDEAVTSGSLSVQESGIALARVGAEARAIYLAAAALRLGVSADSLRVDAGRIVAADGAATSYWELADDALLARDAGGPFTPREIDERSVIGTSVARLDLPDKIFGLPRFIHDLDLPGMRHGRVLRPPSMNATLDSLDDAKARAAEGVIDVVRDGNWIGVLAMTERAADASIATLASEARWRTPVILPDENDLAGWLVAAPRETSIVAGCSGGLPIIAAHPEAAPIAVHPEAVPIAAHPEAAPIAVHPEAAPIAVHPPVPALSADPDSATMVAASTLRARYSKPFIAHASLAPSCAVARWTDERLEVWTHSQGIYNLRRDLALAFRIPESSIVVRHVEGAGCYGHNGADDVAFDAARLARAAPGTPVRVQWSRADELAWSPFGPGMAIDLEAGLDARGEVVSWRHEIHSNGHSARPGRAATPALLGAWQVADAHPPRVAINPALASGGGAERNAVPLYGLPNCDVICHRVLDAPLRTSALRSLGAFANVFAIESFVDEIAALIGEDPVAWRLRHLADPRARAVIERVASNAAWSRAAADRRETTGRGIGFARYKNTGSYCAVIAEVEVGRALRVRRLSIAVDVGLAVNPDGVAAQIEGGAIQATSWTLREAVRFDRARVTSDSWDVYPILRFSEVPCVDVDIIARPDCASTGAGEAALGPTAAAIGNALADALGVRVRDLPLSPERIVAAMP